jgi:hypothetical protein
LKGPHTIKRLAVWLIRLNKPVSKYSTPYFTKQVISMAAARYKMISIPEAQATVLQHTPVLESEQVPLAAALGRVLAETVTARDNLPPFPASIMVGKPKSYVKSQHKQ